MWQTAIQNFAVAETVATADPDGLELAAQGLAPGGLRTLVRYQASEVNRLFFSGWSWVQLGLASAAFGLAWLCGCGRAVVALVGAMLLITIGLAAYVVPESVRLGRLMDFAVEGSLPEIESMFWTLHHTYSGVDLAKFAMGLAAAGVACRHAARKARSRGL